MKARDCKPDAPAALPEAHGSDIVCKLVGADASDNTITLQLPPGLRPHGMVMGEMLTINRIGPNAERSDPA